MRPDKGIGHERFTTSEEIRFTKCDFTKKERRAERKTRRKQQNRGLNTEE